MNNSDEYLAWLDCKCEVCAPIMALAHDKPAYDALFDQTQRKCRVYRAYCNREMVSHSNRFCMFENCDQHPAEDDTLCEGHRDDEKQEKQLLLHTCF